MHRVEIPLETTVVASADTATAAAVWREAAVFAQTVRGRVVFCLLDLDDSTLRRFVAGDRGRLIGAAELRRAGRDRWAALLEELEAKYVPCQFWVADGTGDELLLSCVEAVGAPLVMLPRHFNASRPELAQKIRDLVVAGESVKVLFVEIPPQPEGRAPTTTPASGARGVIDWAGLTMVVAAFAAAAVNIWLLPSPAWLWWTLIAAVLLIGAGLMWAGARLRRRPAR